MPFFSTDPHQPGVIAVGSEAVGVFAFGQLATGVVAVGQMARGVFVLGQLAVGIVGVGQGVACVAWGGGMVGIAGRGFGIVLRVFPKLRPQRGRPPTLPPPCTSMPQLASGATGTRGTVFATLRDGVLRDERGAEIFTTERRERSDERLNSAPEGEIALVLEAVDVEVDDVAYRAAAVKDRALAIVDVVPWKRWPWPFESFSSDGPASFGELVLRGLGMVALVVGWWFAAGNDVVAAVVEAAAR